MALFRSVRLFATPTGDHFEGCQSPLEPSHESDLLGCCDGQVPVLHGRQQATKGFCRFRDDLPSRRALTSHDVIMRQLALAGRDGQSYPLS